MAAPDTTAHGDVGAGGTIIHRKAQAGRAEHQARAMSLAKALRLTVARVADDLLDVAVAAIGVRSQRCPGDEISEHLDGGGLLMLLDGPARARGAAIFDLPLVGALIQQQTMGKVLDAGEDGERSMTPTDAAVSAPYLDAVLERVARLPEAEEEQRLIAGYRFGAWIEDARVLAMALDTPDYEVIRIQLDIAGGLRQGRILLCLPRVAEEAEATVPSGDAKEGEDPRRGPRPRTLADTVQKLEAELRVSIAELRMSLRRLSGLQPGSVIEIGAPSFNDVRIQSFAGKTVSRGGLGQVDGMRAVQVKVDGATPRQQDGAGDQAGSGANAFGMGLSVGAEATVDAVSYPEGDAPADLPQPDTDAPLPDLPDLPEFADLPDLPDMSDLPDFDEDDPLPKLSVG